MKADSYLLKADFSRSYPTIARGRGVYLYDEQGRDYLDASSGAIIANLGHAVPEVAAAAARQLEAIAYTYRTQFTSQSAETLAKRLIGKAPDKAKAFFLSSGSEATEAAIRLIRQHFKERGLPQKRAILTRRVSYHGNTLGALSLSSDARRHEISGYTMAEPSVPACYCYRCPLDKRPDTCSTDCADVLEAQIRHLGPENVAAFVAEPIVGATGAAILPKANYFSKIRSICDRYDILLVADEVITGMGRTGKWFAMDHFGVHSDITILGKGINAGYTPLSALLISEKVLHPIAAGSGRVSIGHTHSGNPFSAAIAGAVLDVLEGQGLVARARTVGPRLGAGLQALQERFPFIGDVRGLGFLWGLEFVADPQGRKPFAREMAVTDRITDLAFEAGLIIYPCRGLLTANEGDGVLIAPPLTTTEAEIDALLARLAKALARLSASLQAA